MSSLSECLKDIRFKTGDSLREMAIKLNISASYLSAIENEKRNIPEDFFFLICKGYNLSEKEKKNIKSAILASNSNYKIDLTSICEKKRRVLLSITEDEIDDETVEKLCGLLDENENDIIKF